ncbi:hypothetical protein ACLOJK_040583 [Asimina triloba]
MGPSNVPSRQTRKMAPLPPQATAAPGPSTSDLSGSNKARSNQNDSSFRQPKGSHMGKRKDFERQEDDETATVQSRPLPRDVFRLRQMQRTRGISSSQTGSAASAGSGFSGEPSGSTD